MLDKFSQVYAKIVAESTNSRIARKNNKKRIVKEDLDGAEKKLTVSYSTDDEGNVTCRTGSCTGQGKSLEEALRNFARKFDSSSLTANEEAGDECECEGDECNDEECNDIEEDEDVNDMSTEDVDDPSCRRRWQEPTENTDGEEDAEGEGEGEGEGEEQCRTKCTGKGKACTTRRSYKRR